jgi:hypothetical protein
MTNDSYLKMFYLDLSATIKRFDFLHLAWPLNVSYKVNWLFSPIMHKFLLG